MDLRTAALYLQVPSEECIDFLFFSFMEENRAAQVKYTWVLFSLFIFMKYMPTTLTIPFTLMFFTLYFSASAINLLLRFQILNFKGQSDIF